MKLKQLALMAGVTAAAMAAAIPAFAQTVIKVWSIDGTKGPGIHDTYSADFNAANSDIKIEYRVLPFDEIVNETLRAAAIGQAPDIVTLDNPNFALFSARGGFLDLTDRIAKSSVIKADVYFPGPLKSVTWDGKFYGIPRYTDTLGLFYNKDLFEKAGIKEPPKTWSELVETAAKLTDPANKVYGITFSARAGEEGTYGFLPWIQMGGGAYNNVNVPGAVKALATWKEIVDARSASPDVLSMGWWDSTATFNSGNAAMAISGPWELTRMSSDAKFKWGVVPLPTETEGGAHSSAMGGWNAGIMASTKHPDEAFKVLEFFASKDDKIFGQFTRIPARSDIALPSTGDEQKDAALKVFVEELKFAQPRGPHPEWQKISKAIYDALQRALTGQVSPQEALDRAQETIQGITG